MCVCVFSLHACWPLPSVTCTVRIQNPVGTISKSCIHFWQHALNVFLCVMLQFYDVRVVDHLVTVSQGALGNHERHFLNAAKEWPCHDWRNGPYRVIYIFLSLWFPAQRLWICSLVFPNVPKRHCFFYGYISVSLYPQQWYNTHTLIKLAHTASTVSCQDPPPPTIMYW